MKLLLSLSLLCAISANAASVGWRKTPQSASNVTSIAAVPGLAPEPATPKWAFAAGEFSAESFYTARFSGDFNDAQQGIGVGVGYAITPNIVASVRGVSYLESNIGVNELSGRLTYRAQLPFLSRKLAAYAFTEGGGNLQTGTGFAGAGGGVEWRPLWQQLGLFAESDLRLDTEWVSSIGISGGVRLSF